MHCILALWTEYVCISLVYHEWEEKINRKQHALLCFCEAGPFTSYIQMYYFIDVSVRS